MSVNKVSMNTLIVQIDDMINQCKCECTQENKHESLAYVSQRVLRLWCACESPCVRVCVSGGLVMNTLTHTKVNGMTHGDLYVRIPSRSSVRLALNRGKKGRS